MQGLRVGCGARGGCIDAVASRRDSLRTGRESPPSHIRNALPAKNDRSFVFVPMGYLDREPRCLQKIIDALDLTVKHLPNIAVVCAEPTSKADVCHVQHPTKHRCARYRTRSITERDNGSLRLTCSQCVQTSLRLGPIRRSSLSPTHACPGIRIAPRKEPLSSSPTGCCSRSLAGFW